MKTLIGSSFIIQISVFAVASVLAATACWFGLCEVSMRWVDFSSRHVLLILIFFVSVTTSGLMLLVIRNKILLPLRLINKYNLRQVDGCSSDDCMAMLIPEAAIPSGEIGDLMKSRNMMLGHLARTMSEVQESYRKIMKLEKLKDDLSQMIVHDLKNPLGIILLSLEITAKEKKTPTAQKETLQQAHRSGMHMLSMIQNLLDISKMEEGKFHLKKDAVDLGVLVKEIEDQFRRSGLPAERTLITKVDEGLPTLEGDVDLLTRVVENLLGNAMKYTARNGRIEMRVAKKSDHEVLVSVSDNGSGIPSEFQSRIFEKFEQVETRTKNHRTGSGLGLTFCKLAVEAHNGRIWVESETGKGSTFFFALRAKTEKTAVTAQQGSKLQKQTDVLGSHQDTASAMSFGLIRNIRSNQKEKR